MKKEFSTKPQAITEAWPGELDMFSWQDLIAAIPTTMFVVTGWKPNGEPNACMQAWSTFTSSEGEFICIISAVNKGGHMYQSLKETGCCVLNFPSRGVLDRCMATIENNSFDTDEITASGLTSEKAVKVNAPRIAECFLNIECELLWEQAHFPGSSNVTMALKSVHLGMDSTHFDENRYGETGYVYNINGARNPDTGEVLPVDCGVIKTMRNGDYK